MVKKECQDPDMISHYICKKLMVNQLVIGEDDDV